MAVVKNKSAPQEARPSRLTSLRLEIMVISTFLVLAMSATVGLTAVGIYRQQLIASQVAGITAAARGGAALLSAESGWHNFHWPILTTLGADLNINLALVVDAKGKTIFSGPGDMFPRASTSIQIALNEGQIDGSFDGQQLSAAAPIWRESTIIGAICFTGQSKALEMAKRASLIWLSNVLVLNIVLMGLFSVFFLNKRLVAPLKELGRDLGDLSHDKFQPRTRPSSSHEIDMIFKAFDQAAAELMASRRQLEKQLQTIKTTKAQLIASEKTAAVGRLASGLAHELGNPIGALIGFIHLLQQDDLDEADKELILRQSAHELERMDSSIKEMLRFSRPSRREPEPVDAADVAQAAINLTRPQKWAEGLNIRLECDLERPLVMAERNSLLQVFLNLLANAGQALTGFQLSPLVRIKIDRPDKEGQVKIQIIDNGPGVAPDDVPQLFEPYFSRKEPGQGTGLGLAICLSIINGFNGTLAYSHNEGGGAIFTIMLPKADLNEKL